MPRTLSDRDLKDRAHALIRQGKLASAAEVYLELITQNSQDASLRLHHAELCDRLQRKDRAIASYQVAAHLLSRAGHTSRAKAALHCGLRIDPTDPGLRRMLRELTPPPKLALVPPPPLVPDDEALTDPFLVTEAVWCQAVERTVCQRAPTRPRRTGSMH